MVHATMLGVQRTQLQAELGFGAGRGFIESLLYLIFTTQARNNIRYSNKCQILRYQ